MAQNKPANPGVDLSRFPTMARDLATRSRDLRWPPGFDPDAADWFSHNSATIDASVDRVWHELVSAPRWPSWYPLCEAFVISDGSPELRAGAHFSWTTFGLSVEGDVVAYDPPNRISWTGYAAGTSPTFYHQWLLAPDGNGCVATYDEVGVGDVAIRMRDVDEADMHRGHDLLLAGLRWTSERRVPEAG